tara:strand:+ start:1466 stop:2206 length:741 start_codon:yes stop_codon:yes gene_type:complete
MKENLNEHVLIVRDIKYAYNDAYSHGYKKSHKTILDIPYWALEKGKSVFLHGESGSGKSTLLNLLSGMLVSQAGEIKVGGTNLGALNARQRDRFRAEHIGVVFQQFNLIPYLTVMDNVLLAANFAAGLSPEMEQKAKELFAQVNLPESIYQQKAISLSIGQQQRVAIVRALVNSPDILLVDEPTSALDANNRDAFIRLLLTVVSRHSTSLVFVSHDLSLASYFDETIALSSINRANETKIQQGAVQ